MLLSGSQVPDNDFTRLFILIIGERSQETAIGRVDQVDELHSFAFQLPNDFAVDRVVNSDGIAGTTDGNSFSFGPEWHVHKKEAWNLQAKLFLASGSVANDGQVIFA